jgi:thiol-disulfide isomerase/thioredoxin
VRRLRQGHRGLPKLAAGAVALWGLSAPALTAAAAEREIHPVDDAAWRQVLTEQAGKIVVVDFWATWCLPCLDRFPAMVDLAERYADRGVTFIAFSLDDLEDTGAMQYARRFVTEQGGRIEHYVTAEPITTAFDQLGLLGIPAVYVYDPEGELFRRLTTDDPNHQFTDEDVERSVRALLGE